MSAAPSASAAPWEKPFWTAGAALAGATTTTRDNAWARGFLPLFRSLTRYSVWPVSSATARPRRSSERILAAGRGRASASEVMRVRVAALMAADTARRQALRVTRLDGAFGPMPTSNTRSARMPSRSVMSQVSPALAVKSPRLRSRASFSRPRRSRALVSAASSPSSWTPTATQSTGSSASPFVQISNCMFTLALSRRVGCFKVAKCNSSLFRWPVAADPRSLHPA